MRALVPVIAAAAALFAAPAFAQTYMAVGYTNNSVDDLDVTTGSLSGVLGSHINEHFGAEVQANIGVSDGSTTFMSTPVDVSVNYEIGAFLVGYVPLGDKVEIFGRLGVSTGEGEVSSSVGSASDTGSGFAGGVGIQGFFNDHIGLRAEYTRSDTMGADQFSIQGAFRF